MRRASTTRVAHPFASFAKGWGIARSASALLLVAGTSLLSAQSPACGLSSITETGKLEYPVMALAAHIQGPVVLLATFEQDGSVSTVKIVSAPVLLNQLIGKIAAAYVKGWKANAFSGPRECPVAVTFTLEPGAFEIRDPQHVTVHAPVALIQPQHSIAKSGC